MSPDRFKRIEELYYAARGRPPEERAALLEQTDPELRREIESLLAERSRGEFLDQPAFENAPELLEDPTVTVVAAGVRLGPYRPPVASPVFEMPVSHIVTFTLSIALLPANLSL